ncbi:MAG: hypothetical protein AABY06_00275 [Nanoarchaeota archaeon]
MKNLKLLIATGILAGSLAFGGCNQKGNELEKYNQENNQVYKDFVKFGKEKGEKNGKFYTINMSKENEQEIYAEINDKKIYLEIRSEIEINKGENLKNTISFYDNFSNGLSNRDLWIDALENVGMRGEIIKEPYNNFYLNLAKNYTNILKEIMHKEKFKGY